jgi:hypothetical protein
VISGARVSPFNTISLILSHEAAKTSPFTDIWLVFATCLQRFVIRVTTLVGWWLEIETKRSNPV